MSEYLNYGALGVFIFFAIVVFFINYASKESHIGFLIIVAICIGFILFDANSQHKTALKNVSDFKNKRAVLKCISGGGLYSSANTYKVSIDDGWSVDKDYFIKDSLMVRANKCESW